MTEMTYTLRDLNRQPAKVMKACDLYGQVKIRTRAGKTYVVQAEQTPKKRLTTADVRKHFEAHRKRLRAMGYVPPPPEQMERINQIIAGEI